MFGSLNKTSPCTNSPPHQKLEIRFWGREDHGLTGEKMISLVLSSKHGCLPNTDHSVRKTTHVHARAIKLKAADKEKPTKMEKSDRERQLWTRKDVGRRGRDTFYPFKGQW